MNVKPGDLAVTRGMFHPENNDIIVEVLRLSHVPEFWWVNSRSPMRRSDDGKLRNGDGLIHDSNLKPISGVPVTDDMHDEVTA